MGTPGEYRVIGYLRVSTAEQADSGAGLAAQRAQIQSAVDYRDWTLTRVLEDAGVSGKSLSGRPALQEALHLLANREADALVVAKLDRLSRSLLDFAGLMEQARHEGWNLVALDLGIDLSTPAGEFLSNVMASAAQWERRIIGQRTKDALAARRAAGVTLGRPRVLPQEVVARIASERQAGATLQGIADGLMADDVPTARGGDRWYPSSVRSILSSASS
ncbi:MAG: recombinase family protein [Candidatus Nanopelagicales bacterium]